MPPMEALAAAAATATPTIMPSDSAAGGGGHPGPWTFPVFVGCRRRLAPDDELFEAGNLEREALAREVGARLVNLLCFTNCCCWRPAPDDEHGI